MNGGFLKNAEKIVKNPGREGNYHVSTTIGVKGIATPQARGASKGKIWSLDNFIGKKKYI